MTSNLLKPHKWARRLVWALAGLVLLIGLSWALVPPILKSQLEKRASEELGRQVSLGRVDFKPWTLELELSDLAIAAAARSATATATEAPQLQIKRLYIDASIQSLRRLAPVVDAITLDGLDLRVTHLGDGHYDFDDILAKLKNRPKEPDDAAGEKPLQFALFNLALTGAKMDFVDKSVSKTHQLRDLNLAVPFLSNLDAQREVKTEPRLAFNFNGSRFDSGAQSTPFADNHKTDATLRLSGFDLKPYLPYIPASVPVRLQSGVLDATVKLAFEQTTRPTVKLSGVVDLKTVKVADHAGQDLLTLDALKLALEDVRPLEQVVKLSLVELTAPSLSVTRDKLGKLNLLPPDEPQNATKKVAVYAHPEPVVATISSKPPAWKVEVAKVALRGGSLAWRDETTTPKLGLDLKELNIDATAIAWPFVQPLQFSGAAMLEGAPPAKTAQAAAKLNFSGQATDQAATVNASLADLPLALAGPYAAQFLAPALTGLLSSDVSLNWSPTDLKVGIQHLVVTQLALSSATAAAGKRGASAGQNAALASLKKLEINDGQLDLTQQTIVVGKLALHQPGVTVERGKDGHWMYEAWLKPPAAPGVAGNKSAAASASNEKGDRGGKSDKPVAAKPWTLTLAEIALDGGNVRFFDQAPAKPVALELSALKINLKNFTLDAKKPLPLMVSARLRGLQNESGSEPGQLDYKGNVGLSPLSAQGSLAATQIPVHVFEPYFGDAINLELLRAELGFKGEVRYLAAATGPVVKVTGDSVLEEFRANSARQAPTGATASASPEPAAGPGPGEELLSWKALSLRGLDVALAPGAATTVSVAETALTDFFARILINESGRINLQDLVKADGASAPAATESTAGAAPTAAVPGAPASTAPAGTAPNTAASAVLANTTNRIAIKPIETSVVGLSPIISFGPISLINGRVFFSDHFIKPNYSANLSELTGRLGAFSSVPGATQTAAVEASPAASASAPASGPDANVNANTGTGAVAASTSNVQMAELELRGRAESTASLEILGKLNPLAKPLALDIKAKVRDLELPPMSPYSVKYAGHGIERGKLSVDLGYVVLPNGQLTASNNIILNQLKFGDAVPGAPNSLPVRLAVALLADRNGVIDINLPVSGSLSDPQFRLGPIIFKVIVNLIVKAITSPFTLLASAFGGGGDELSMVSFAPGTAKLGPDAQQGLDKVAKALVDRPALKLTVVGSASLEAEREAYKQERLKAMLQGEKRRAAVVSGAASQAASTNAAAGALADAALVTDAETPALLKEVYKRSDITKPRNLVGMAKDIPETEMKALLLANIAVTSDLMNELALQRGIAVKDYLASKQLPVERLFLGAAKPAGTDAKWTPRAELNLATN